VKALVLTATLVLLAALTYANAISSPFVYDDVQLIVKNPKVQSLSRIPELLGFGDDGFSLRNRWTRDVTYAVEFAAAGHWAPLYHLTNIILHIGVALLVFLLIRRVSGDWLLAWLAAAFFAVHPINTEVVAHISGRRGLLAALFSLTALILLHGYARHRGLWRIGGAMLALYLGAFSKEVAIMAPVVFVLIDLYRRRPDGRGDGQDVAARRGLLVDLRNRLLEGKGLYSVLVLTTLALLIGLLFFSEAGTGFAGSPGYYATTGPGLDVMDRVRIAGMGIRLLLFPVGQSVDYSYDALGMTTGSVSVLAVLDIGLLVISMGLIAFGLWRRWWLGFGGAWAVLFYLPHAGFIPWHEVFAERFLYLSSIGFCVVLAAWTAHFLRTSRGRTAAAVAALLIMGLLVTGTVLRNSAWSSGVNLWESAVSRYPSSARAQKALGDEYLAQVRPDLAIEHYRKAATILPAFKDAHVGVVGALTGLSRHKDAMDVADEILQRWPGDPMTLHLKGFIQQSLGRPEEALELYQSALESDPTFAQAYNNLGRLYVEKNDIETALRMYETALQHDPSLSVAYWNLAVVYRDCLEDEEQASMYEAKARALKQSVR